VGLAARGSRNLDEGEEQITPGDELAQVRRQARRVQIKTVAAAAVATGIALVLP
jgi:hypothetical protein